MTPDGFRALEREIRAFGIDPEVAVDDSRRTVIDVAWGAPQSLRPPRSVR